jgi:hypothetical protein
MKTIEYRITYTYASYDETVRVQARNINSGFSKALKLARKPLGNGREREIARIEFWQVV